MCIRCVGLQRFRVKMGMLSGSGVGVRVLPVREALNPTDPGLGFPGQNTPFKNLAASPKY